MTRPGDRTKGDQARSRTEEASGSQLQKKEWTEVWGDEMIFGFFSILLHGGSKWSNRTSRPLLSAAEIDREDEDFR